MGKYNLHSVVLENWQRKIKAFQDIFIELSIQHIYWSFNMVVDGLSNGALLLDVGLFSADYFLDGALVSSKTFFSLLRSLFFVD